MNFVTKKQFEDAVAKINDVLKNGQLVDGYAKIPLSQLLFATDGANFDTYRPDQVSFIDTELAIKDKLFNLRKELKKQREDATRNQKALEELEKEEKKLQSLLTVTKE